MPLAQLDTLTVLIAALGLAGSCVVTVVGCTFWIVKNLTGLRKDVQSMSEHEDRQDARLDKHEEWLAEQHRELGALRERAKMA